MNKSLQLHWLHPLFEKSNISKNAVQLLVATSLLILLSLILLTTIQWPQYRELRSINLYTQNDTIRVYELISKGMSDLKLEIHSENQEKFDFYVLYAQDFEFFKKYARRKGNDLDKIYYIHRAENVSEVNAENVSIGAGKYYFIFDNSDFGSLRGDADIKLNFRVFEKY